MKIASPQGFVAVVMLLLTYGAEPSLATTKPPVGSTPSMLAAMNGHAEVVEAIAIVGGST